MRITDDVARAMQGCVDSLGSLAEFSRRTGVRIEILTRYLSRQTQSINSDTWGQLYPLLKPFLAPEEEDEKQPKMLGTHARMHRDLVSLTSDEKVLLDAFSALPSARQQELLKSIAAEAESEYARQRRG